MKKFRLHWIGGKTEEVEGADIADACRGAGIGGGALKALDYYELVVVAAVPATTEGGGK